MDPKREKVDNAVMMEYWTDFVNAAAIMNRHGYVVAIEDGASVNITDLASLYITKK